MELDKQYPQYQLAKHKGYPTKLHYELIAQYGIQPFYRRSFLKAGLLAGERQMNRAETVRRGEAAAARWYQKQGAQLLAHNYHTRMGELDLVLGGPDGIMHLRGKDPAAKGSLAAPCCRRRPGQAAPADLRCAKVFAADRPKRRTGAF